MKQRYFGLTIRPEVFEVSLWDMRHTGMPTQPGFLVLDIVVFGHILFISFGMTISYTSRSSRLEDIAENLRTIELQNLEAADREDQVAINRSRQSQDEQSVTK